MTIIQDQVAKPVSVDSANYPVEPLETYLRFNNHHLLSALHTNMQLTMMCADDQIVLIVLPTGEFDTCLLSQYKFDPDHVVFFYDRVLFSNTIAQHGEDEMIRMFYGLTKLGHAPPVPLDIKYNANLRDSYANYLN